MTRRSVEFGPDALLGTRCAERAKSPPPCSASSTWLVLGELFPERTLVHVHFGVWFVVSLPSYVEAGYFIDEGPELRGQQVKSQIGLLTAV